MARIALAGSQFGELPGAITRGGLRVGYTPGIAGAIDATTVTLARNAGSVRLPLAQMSQWASAQAHWVSQAQPELAGEHLHCNVAAVVAALGGAPDDLYVAQSERHGWMKLGEVVNSAVTASAIHLSMRFGGFDQPPALDARAIRLAVAPSFVEGIPQEFEHLVEFAGSSGTSLLDLLTQALEGIRARAPTLEYNRDGYGRPASLTISWEPEASGEASRERSPVA